MFGAIYLLATLRQQYPQVEQFITGMLKDLDGSGTTFLNFMVAQGTVTMILLAFAGSVLAGNDHSRGGLIFYLSRRINVMHYAAGKLLAIGLIISLTTTLPALVLFFRVRFAWGYRKIFLGKIPDLFRNTRLRGVAFCGGRTVAFRAGVVDAEACAAGDAVGRVVCLSPILSRILAFAMREPGMSRRDAMDESPWRLLDFWNDLYIVGNKFFGVDKPLFTGAAVVVLCGLYFFGRRHRRSIAPVAASIMTIEGTTTTAARPILEVGKCLKVVWAADGAQ